MECTQYEAYELGKLGPEVFEQHLATCASCRQNVKADHKLLNLVSKLDATTQTPDLWPAIVKEISKGQKHFQLPFLHSYYFKIAAALLIGLGMIFLFNYKSPPPLKSLLDNSALQDVEQKEQSYLRSIELLEQVAATRQAKLDINLNLLYRDKLETIDAQIERCNDALKSNPANTHIRRYLIAALRDKKETLREILQ